MKKNLRALCLVLLSSLMFSITALAGDINSGEQSVIDAISGTYEYEGAHYKVTDEYIAKVADYLSRDDIDLSETEAYSYILQFEMNIGAGIKAGYMVKVDDGSDSSDNKGTGNNNNDKNSGSNTDTNKSETDNPLSGYFNQSESEDGVVEDNTLGSTMDGKIEYTVFPVDKQTMYVWGVDTLEVHAEAYKDSEVIGTLNKVDAVTIIGAATTGWAQIEYDNVVGYVSAVYLRTEGYMISIGEIAVSSDEDGADGDGADADGAGSDGADADGAGSGSNGAGADGSGLNGSDGADANGAGLDGADGMDSDADASENVKDYSDAAPVAKSLNLGLLALVIVIIFAIGVGVVIFWHKNKNGIFRKR